jgi:hypothetical protein
MRSRRVVSVRFCDPCVSVLARPQTARRAFLDGYVYT